MKTIKERAHTLLAGEAKHGDLIEFVYEIANAPEPEPVGEAVNVNGWEIVLWKGKESDFPVGTKFYAIPPANNQSEQHLEMVRDAERHLACNGSNCGCTDGISHSDECILDHDAIVNEAALADHVEHGGWKCFGFGCGYDGQDNQRYNRICARCGVHR